MRRAIIYPYFSLFCFFILFPFVSHAAGPTKISYSVDSPSVWTKENSPYIVQNHVVVNAPLTIEAGTVVKFVTGLADLNIKNNFYVNGTREESVFFTSIHDDTDGNDSDESSTNPNIGDWSSVIFNPFQDREMKIKYAEIRYSSSGVYIIPSSSQTKDISVKNCKFEKNGAGILVGNAEPVVEKNTITNNITGIKVNNTSTKTTKAISNAIFANGTGAFGKSSLYPDATVLNAEYNWWGDESGPQNASNPNGKGNSVTGQVSFDPWIKEDPIQTPDPVIVIPGIMGSWEKDGAWQIDPIFHAYDNLYEEFANNGYIPEQNLFTFPYQWRDSNKVNAVELRAKIQEIKDETRRPKVDIVAHSMGGLLAREYIESSYYEDNVDQLITVGTPQLGAPKDYITWEAGEFTGHWAYFSKVVFKQEAEESGYYGYDNIFDYIQGRPIESVRELLPVYNYLYDASSTSLKESYPVNYPRNEFLENLNSLQKINVLGKVDFVKIIGKLGDNESTISGFNVLSEDKGKLWKDGFPKWFGTILEDLGMQNSDGDKTVPLYSAEATQIPADRTIYLQSEHNNLPTDAQKDILEILTGKRPTSEVNEWRIDDILISLVFSPVDIQIVSPSGKRLGKNFETGGEYDEIAGAFYTGYDSKTEFITIPNPENGEYKILVQGMEEGEYKIETTKITEGENDPLVAKESTATITGIAETGKMEEAEVEVTEDEVTYNPDTAPPVITNGSPNGELPDAVTETQISLETNEKATCRYSTDPEKNFDLMTDNFSTIGGLVHSAQISRLRQYTSYHFFARCRDESGNTNQEDYEISFKVPDKTPPSITGAVTTESNVNGWYKGDVVVHFTATDDESGIDTITPDITISTEGANQSVTGTATDKAGNTASFTVSGINIDKTPPAITIASPEEKKYLNDQILPISYEVTDNISLSDKISVTVIYDGENFSGDNVDLSLENLGEHIFKVTAADEAGNTSEKIINFQNTTSLSAIQNNVDHYWELGLIKKKFVRKYLAIRLKHLENLFNLLEKTNSNPKLKPKIKENLAKEIKRAINQEIDQIIRWLNRKFPKWIDEKAAEFLIEDLNYIRP